MFINHQVKPEFVFTDEHGRFVGVEIHLHSTKTIVLGIYAQNENKVMFYKQFLERLIDFPYEHCSLMGDWDGMRRVLKFR